MAVKNDLSCYKGETVTFYFGITPASLTSAALAANQTTIPLLSTDGMPSAGTAYVLVDATPTSVTYTGKTPTTLTGCTGVPAVAKTGALVTSGSTDVTGMNFSMTIRASATDANPELLTVAAVLLTPKAAGMLSVSMTSAQTKTTLGVGEFAYDVQRTDAGSEAVLSIGTLDVKQEVLFP